MVATIDTSTAGLRYRRAVLLVPSERIPTMSWISRTIASERKALDRVRRAFVREPTQEGLHRVRTGARRLRSFLEDVSERHRQKQLLRRAKRTAELTDIARDAAVQRALLERLLDESEREAAEALLASLCEREMRATASARRKLKGVRYKIGVRREAGAGRPGRSARGTANSAMHHRRAICGGRCAGGRAGERRYGRAASVSHRGEAAAIRTRAVCRNRSVIRSDGYAFVAPARRARRDARLRSSSARAAADDAEDARPAARAPVNERASRAKALERRAGFAGRDVSV